MQDLSDKHSKQLINQAVVVIHSVITANCSTPIVLMEAIMDKIKTGIEPVQIISLDTSIIKLVLMKLKIEELIF